MALNKYMHPRNIYKNRKPIFKSLSTKYDYFREKTTVNESGKVILDFKDPAALRALTRALLEDDFGLSVVMPLDRLIPTVPQRLNYILWLEDIIGRDNGAKGIDIGTGASCIYPLLGCRLNKWSFIASEIDDQNIHFATKNITNNKMEDKITVKKVTDETLLLGLIDEDKTYDFCMCNPPFYSDHLEAQGITSSRNDNRSESSSVSTASEAESIAWGGEVRFITQMIEESLLLKTKVRVYSSLLGKKNSLGQLKDVIHKKQIAKFSTTEFCQGRTMRWGIAWTFDENVQFPKSTFKEQKKEKPPLTFEIPRSSASVVGDYTVQSYTWFIIKQMEELNINFFTKHSGKFYTCFIIQAKENTWSHQRRKRRQQNRQQNDSQSERGDKERCENSFKSRQSKKEGIRKSEDGDDGSVYNTLDIKESTEQNDGGEMNIDDKKATVDRSENIAQKGDGVEEMEHLESKSLKRSAGDVVGGSEAKRIKSIASDASGGNTVTDESNIIEKNIKSAKSNQLIEEKGAKTEGNNGKSKDVVETDINKLVRKEVIERFWKEQEENVVESKKRKEKSFVEVLEPFKEDDECLLLSKLVVRKDEGVISFSLTHLAGQREAMHQIVQYFKNKWIVQ